MDIGVYRLTGPTLGVLETTHCGVMIPAGEFVKVRAPGEDHRIVNVIWDEQPFVMFVEDLKTRSKFFKNASGVPVAPHAERPQAGESETAEKCFRPKKLVVQEDDGRFVISELESAITSLGKVSHRLSEDELKDELKRRGLQDGTLQDLIGQAKEAKSAGF